jgi:hypothetical protein
MYELILIELIRARRMAEVVGEAFLLYLIDIAIVEAKRRSIADRRKTVAAQPPEHAEPSFAA